jgi:hypothetical protein
VVWFRTTLFGVVWVEASTSPNAFRLSSACRGECIGGTGRSALSRVIVGEHGCTFPPYSWSWWQLLDAAKMCVVGPFGLQLTYLQIFLHKQGKRGNLAWGCAWHASNLYCQCGHGVQPLLGPSRHTGSLQCICLWDTWWTFPYEVSRISMLMLQGQPSPSRFAPDPCIPVWDLSLIRSLNVLSKSHPAPFYNSSCSKGKVLWGHYCWGLHHFLDPWLQSIHNL